MLDVCRWLATMPWYDRLGWLTYEWVMGRLPTGAYLRIMAAFLRG